MARNKYPEETIERILEVSLELFIKNGYENTSIQDIINNLGGLTKGAIYHHFKSKEKILEAVADKIYSTTEEKVKSIMKDSSLNGLEKLRKLFESSIGNPNQEKMFAASPMLLNNPSLLAMQLKESIEVVAPNYIKPIIEEGIKDGSIKTDYPKELAEVMIILSNIWLNPLVYSVSQEDMINKIKFYDVFLKGMGINIFDKSMYEKLIKLDDLTKR